MSIPWFTLVITMTAVLMVKSQLPSESTTQYPDDIVALNGNYSNDTTVQGKRHENYGLAVLFKFYKNGQLTYISNGINVESIQQTGCTPSDQFAFLLHGWRETCEVDWMRILIEKLTVFRGGCIICIDYGQVAQDTYVRLLRKFEPLSIVMTNKLKYLNAQGFNPSNGYMFGFSFGGQLASSIGRNFGVRLIKEIDTCDMAGPGFDYKTAAQDHRDAAQNVQCIHTSRDKGTRYYECHQNWRMGNCGITQNAADNPPKGSHGLCPYFYISAFDHPFYAVDQPKRCTAKRPVISWPENFKMGYTEARKQMVDGELFAITGETYPFNIGSVGDLPEHIRPVHSIINEGLHRVKRVRLNTIKKAKALLRLRN